MISFLLDRYNGATHPFPNPNKPPQQKREHDYILQTCEAMYSAYARQRTALTHSDQARFETNRNYGEGKQDPSYYKTILVDDSVESGNSISGGKALADQKRKSWLNVDFENIITYAPKVRDH